MLPLTQADITKICWAPRPQSKLWFVPSARHFFTHCDIRPQHAVQIHTPPTAYIFDYIQMSTSLSGAPDSLLPSLPPVPIVVWQYEPFVQAVWPSCVASEKNMPRRLSHNTNVPFSTGRSRVAGSSPLLGGDEITSNSRRAQQQLATGETTSGDNVRDLACKLPIRALRPYVTFALLDAADVSRICVWCLYSSHALCRTHQKCVRHVFQLTFHTRDGMFGVSQLKYVRFEGMHRRRGLAIESP